jgi:3-hydroxybutyryl-CoA dehydrogenase/5-formyl-3-hydroxy-2-methylpyridine 4-carboxylate dehydrogenase
MGPGIAATLAQKGMEVHCYDAANEATARAKGGVEDAFAVLDRIGPNAGANRGRVHFHDSLEAAVKPARLVIETVPEVAEIKAAVFAALEQAAAPDAILASNTSGIPIARLQEAVSTPGRVVGMHWSNPPHIIPMIEVIAGAKTAPEVVRKLKHTILGLGLLPVVVKKDVPGFVENRVLYAIMRECLALSEDGVIDPEGLDTCIKWGIGFKLSVIGPLELLDVAGLDIYQAVASYLNAELDNRADVSTAITERIARGDLGMKTGKGIYQYTPERIAELRQARAKKLVAVRKILEAP